MRNWIYIFVILLLPVISVAQFEKTVESIEVNVPEEGVQIGDTVALNIHVNMMQDWYLYSSDVGTDEGPLAAEMEFIDHSSFTPVGKLEPVDHKTKHDAFFDVQVNYFPEVGKFRQHVIINEKSPQIRMQLSGQACSDVKQSCVLVNEVINVPEIKVEEQRRTDKPPVSTPGNNKRPKPKTAPSEPKPVFTSRLEELKWEKEQLLKNNPDLKEDLKEFVNKY